MNEISSRHALGQHTTWVEPRDLVSEVVLMETSSLGRRGEAVISKSPLRTCREIEDLWRNGMGICSGKQSLVKMSFPLSASSSLCVITRLLANGRSSSIHERYPLNPSQGTFWVQLWLLGAAAVHIFRPFHFVLGSFFVHSWHSGHSLYLENLKVQCSLKSTVG